MGWLVGYTLWSMASAFIVVKIFDFIFAGAMGSVVSSARAGLFIATWTAVTAKTAMHGFSRRIRDLGKSIGMRKML